MSSPQQSSALSSSPRSSTLMVPSPNPSNSGRWSPLSYHGLPREPKSPTPTYRSSHISSPTSVTSPNFIASSDMTSTRHASYASYESSHLSIQPHHRFDPLSPSPTAYSAPSYTSSITLQPPPVKRPRLPLVPANPQSAANGLGIVGAETDAEQMSHGTGGFCRRMFKKLGCVRGSDERRERKRMMKENVVKIEPVHWTEA